MIQRISTRCLLSGLRSIEWQYVVIVCYDLYDRFQQIPFGDFFREGLTGSKFGEKIWTRIGGSYLGLPQTKTMSNINEEI